MKVKVTVYLKCDSQVSTELSNVDINEVASDYASVIEHGGVIRHNQADGTMTQVIPSSNISFIDIREVAE